MPRKPLDVRKERVRLERQRQTKTHRDISVGCCVRPYLPIYTLLRGSRQVERGINAVVLLIYKLKLQIQVLQCSHDAVLYMRF